jgi:hypothetical protein
VDEEVAYADVKITLGIVFLCLLILAVCALSILYQYEQSYSDESRIDVDQCLSLLI